ncbi:MAG: hypothetical protein ACI9W2_002539, partial [Gammaproteobacteria bacterium]
NLVTRGLGVDANVQPDISHCSAHPGDLYLLCSDGLSDMVEQRQLEAVTKRYQSDPDLLVDTLIEAANNNGGKDNISAVVARVNKAFPLPKRWYVRKSISGKIQFAGRTDVGRIREHNEDSIAIAAATGALIVADGMGGLRAGEVASAMAVRALMEDLGNGVESIESQGPDAKSGWADAEVQLASEKPASAGVVDASGVRDMPPLRPDPGQSEAAPIKPRQAAIGGDAITEKMLGLLDRVEHDVESYALEGGPDSGVPLNEAAALDAVALEAQHAPSSPNFAADGDPDLLAFTEGLPMKTSVAVAGKDYDAVADALQVGTWVELEINDGKSMRARLSWINQATGMYLFTDRRGLAVAQRTHQSLLLELQREAVRILESEPLYDRAVSHLLERLKNEPEHSLAS